MFPLALSGSASASFIDLKPKNASRTTAAYSPIGNAEGKPWFHNYVVKHNGTNIPH